MGISDVNGAKLVCTRTETVAPGANVDGAGVVVTVTVIPNDRLRTYVWTSPADA